VSHDHPKPDDFRFDEDRHAAAVTCKHVWNDGKPILLVSHDGDGGWQFLCGHEHGESATGDALLVCLEHVVSRDPSVNELAAMCTSHIATREHLGGPWKTVDETPNEIRRVIEEYGWWVGLIAADGEGPAFAYTIGLYEKFGHPEIIVFGLPHESMHGILNRCGNMIRDGKRFDIEEPVSGVLEDYEVRFRAVTSEESYANYLGYGCRHYGGHTFPVFQLLWPDKEHRFPGDAGAADFLLERQRLPA
jgi:hypothetical protein